MTYRSSYAVDKNNIDQPIEGLEPVRLEAEQILWDLNGDYYMEGDEFLCPCNGIFNFTASLLLTELENVKRAKMHLYQNGELWATVADVFIPTGETEAFLTANCPSDGLYANDDYFQVYVELVAIDDEADVSGTISGSRERTFWGFDLITEVDPSEVLSDD